jgi:hypothetical protein
MTNKNNHYILATMAEEAAELSQICAKTIRFDNVEEGISEKRMARIVEEYADLIAIVSTARIQLDDERVHKKVETHQEFITGKLSVKKKRRNILKDWLDVAAMSAVVAGFVYVCVRAAPTVTPMEGIGALLICAGLLWGFRGIK